VLDVNSNTVSLVSMFILLLTALTQPPHLPDFPYLSLSRRRPSLPPGFFLGVLARGTLFSARIPDYRAEWAWNRILKVWLRLCLVSEKLRVKITCLDSGIGRVSERVHKKERGM